MMGAYIGRTLREVVDECGGEIPLEVLDAELGADDPNLGHEKRIIGEIGHFRLIEEETEHKRLLKARG